MLRRVAIDRAANERLKEALVKIRQSSPEGTDRELTTAEQHAAIEAQREFLASEGEIAKLLENFHEDDLLTYGPYFIAQSCIEDAYPARGETSSCPAHLKSPITIGRPPRWDVLVGKTAGMTALLHAARDGHIEAAEALLDGGADIDQVSGDGSSPLVLALLNGRFRSRHGSDRAWRRRQTWRPRPTGPHPSLPCCRPGGPTIRPIRSLGRTRGNRRTICRC